MRCGESLLSSFVVLAFRKFTFRSRLSDDQRQFGGKRHVANFLAATIKKNELIGAAKDRSHLIEQPGLDADEPVFRALANFCDFQGRQSQPAKLEEKESGCDFKRWRAGETATRGKIAIDSCGKTINWN